VQRCQAKINLLGALDGWVDGSRTPGELMQVTQEQKAPFKTTGGAADVPLSHDPAL
jgi:hypothetical protein